MPPKRKQAEDTRSPLEIAIAGTEEQIRQCEAQVQQFKDGVQDLAVHSAKIKTLESEIVPREAELKAVLQNFNKLLENSVAVARMRSNTDVEGLPSRGASRAASRAGAGTPLPAPSSPSGDDGSDREAMKVYTQIMREQLTAVLVPLFQTDRTQLEIQLEQAKEREAAEAAAAAAANAAAGGSGAPPSAGQSPSAQQAKSKAAEKVAVGSAVAAAKSAAGDKALPQLSVAEVSSKMDLELYRPPGIDVHVYTDVLKLRTQRLQAERSLKSLTQQLAHSRQLVARRTNEGASKAALKKAEKQLASLVSTLKDMRRQKEDLEQRKKSETPTPAMKGSLKSSVRR